MEKSTNEQSEPGKIKLNLRKEGGISDNSKEQEKSSIRLNLNLKNRPQESKPETSGPANIFDTKLPKAEEVKPDITVAEEPGDDKMENAEEETADNIQEETEAADDNIPPVMLEEKNNKLSLKLKTNEKEDSVKKISDTIKLKLNPESAPPVFSESFESIDDIEEEEKDTERHSAVPAEQQVAAPKAQSKKINLFYIVIALILLLVLIYYIAVSIGSFMSLGG